MTNPSPLPPFPVFSPFPTLFSPPNLVPEFQISRSLLAFIPFPTSTHSTSLSILKPLLFFSQNTNNIFSFLQHPQFQPKIPILYINSLCPFTLTTTVQRPQAMLSSRSRPTCCISLGIVPLSRYFLLHIPFHTIFEPILSLTPLKESYILTPSYRIPSN